MASKSRAEKVPIVSVMADAVLRAFRKLDPAGTGRVASEEFQDALSQVLAPKVPRTMVREVAAYFAIDTTGEVSYEQFCRWQWDDAPTMAWLQTVCNACDVDGDGRLDAVELKFALQACSIFPTAGRIQGALQDLHCQSVDVAQFAALQHTMLRGGGSDVRGYFALPYVRRALQFRQLEDVGLAFISSGWLLAKCQEYNRSQTDGRQEMENLYAINRFVVKKLTHPAGYRDVPEDIRALAKVPEPERPSSYAELINKEGVPASFFVSHYWGHLYRRTLATLQNFLADWPASVASDISFWICLFALDQHNPASEVGTSPEDGPFNAALAKAEHGVLMILDDELQPLKRIWCLFELHRVKCLGVRFELLDDHGPIIKNPPAMLRLAQALDGVRALDALASRENDKLAIWYRIADPIYRRIWTSEKSFESMVKEEGPDFQQFRDQLFSNFDVSMRVILAEPVLAEALRVQNATLALKCLTWGAGQQDDQALRAVAALHGGLLELANKRIACAFARSKGAEVTVLHVVAFYGNEPGTELLCRHGVCLDLS